MRMCCSRISEPLLQVAGATVRYMLVAGIPLFISNFSYTYTYIIRLILAETYCLRRADNWLNPAADVG